MKNKIILVKKLDKFIINSFVGPFFLTYTIVVFILLCQYLITYFQDLIGKNLGFEVYFKLFSYFALNMTPMALPLAMLLSSLMTFGNLGEHFELTAIKSSGISLIRTLVPMLFFAFFLSIFSFFFNDIAVPFANLKAYSLLYDIKQKKPALDFKEGAFYNGLPGYSIKVNKRFPDGKTLKDVMIYNHTKGLGNVEVILSDSGFMSMVHNDKYLMLELYNGTNFSEMTSNNNLNSTELVRNRFTKCNILFSLESFNLQRTQEELFTSNRIMRNVKELNHDSDSLEKEFRNVQSSIPAGARSYYSYINVSEDTTKIHLSNSTLTSLNPNVQVLDSSTKHRVLELAAISARNVKSYTLGFVERLKSLKRDNNDFKIEKYRKYTQAAACLLMFFIGAPLGSIIKRGGLGVPIIVSIIFFILFYVISMTGEKMAREGEIDLELGMWSGNILLFPVGLFFLIQAKNDSKLFDTDFFYVKFQQFTNQFRKNKK